MKKTTIFILILAITATGLFADSITRRIYADNKWQATGVEFEKGDPVIIKAEGTIQYENSWGGKNVSPGGSKAFLSAEYTFPLPGEPEGALIGKIGKNGKIFLVGTNYEGKALKEGELFLRINEPDSRLSDNSGRFSVTIHASRVVNDLTDPPNRDNRPSRDDRPPNRNDRDNRNERDTPSHRPEGDFSFLSELEVEVIDMMNFARTKPKEFAKILREYRTYFRGNRVEIPGEITLITNEGVSAVDEAIRFLERVQPIPAVELSRGMSLACRDHVNDQGPGGYTGHSGTDGSSPFDRMNRYGQWQYTAGENISFGADTAQDIIMQLIIDDGVPGRGHRDNIFNKAFKVSGVAFGDHSGYGVMCVIGYAGGYLEDE